MFNFQLNHKNKVSKGLDLDRRGVPTSPGQSPSVSHLGFDVALNNSQAPLCSSRKMREWSRTHKKQPRKISQNGTAKATSLTSGLKKHCSLQDKMLPLFMLYGRSEKQHKERSQLLERVDNGRTKGNGFKLREGRFRLGIKGKSQREWQGAGTGCPERLWMPHPWRCSRPGWMGPWAAWSSIRYEGWWPCLWQGGWSLMILQVPSNPSHSMILRFYESPLYYF